MIGLALLKGLLRRVRCINEFCHDCGREQPLVWMATDADWAEFATGQHPLCLECFDKRASGRGALIIWTARVDCRWVTVPIDKP